MGMVGGSVILSGNVQKSVVAVIVARLERFIACSKKWQDCKGVSAQEHSASNRTTLREV